MIRRQRPGIVALIAVDRKGRGCRAPAENSRQVCVKQVIFPQGQAAPRIARPWVQVAYGQGLLRLPAAILKFEKHDAFRFQHNHALRIDVDHRGIQNAVVVGGHANPQRSLASSSLFGDREEHGHFPARF